MKNIFTIILIIFIAISCASKKNFKVPVTEKMYQENKLIEKQKKLVKHKDYLKNYTKNFVNSIPEEDLKLIIKDTIIVVYDTTTVR